jgi:hypothetical protein
MRSARVFLLSAVMVAAPVFAQVRITSGAHKIGVSIDGQPFTDFYVAGDDVTKPYLWPLRTTTGTYVTRMWPMEKVDEEANIAKPDHKHQRGVWFAHESVNGLDFWNNEASYTTPNRGKIVLAAPVLMKEGKGSGTITATFDWTDLQGHKVLTETRIMTFYGDKDARRIDFDITLTPAEKVTFGDNKDGAFGVRMRPILQEDKGSGHITNADGLVGEKQLWGKPSNWCDYSGEVRGEEVGIAILDHPDNPRHPVRWHARGYGLFAANPFGVSVFDKSLPKSDLVVEPGQKLRFRYRMVIHTGDVKSADISHEWEKYTAAKSATR